MNKKKITGVRVYILTVDSETNTLLKTEEEDPNTGHRTELAPSFQPVARKAVPARRLAPPGFTQPIGVPTRRPSPPRRTVPIGVPPPPPSPPRRKPPKPSPARRPAKKEAEHEKSDRGGPPKV